MGRRTATRQRAHRSRCKAVDDKVSEIKRDIESSYLDDDKLKQKAGRQRAGQSARRRHRRVSRRVFDFVGGCSNSRGGHAELRHQHLNGIRDAASSFRIAEPDG